MDMIRPQVAFLDPTLSLLRQPPQNIPQVTSNLPGTAGGTPDFV